MDVETVETLGQRLAPGLGPEHAAAAVEHPDLALQAAVPRPVAHAHGQHSVEQLRARRRQQVGAPCPGEALAREHRHRIAEIGALRSEEHTSELQSLMRISYAVFCLTKTNHDTLTTIMPKLY